jgi:uncharacterized protein (TIGR00106 family)
MKVLVDICVVPMGVGVSVSEYVVECQRIFEAANLSHEMHSWGTNVEGEWDKVMAAVCMKWVRRAATARCGSVPVPIASKACRTSWIAFTPRWGSE